MVEFNKSGLESNFIKYLLEKAPLPNIRTISNYTYIVKDCYYIYKSYIIKCIASGYFLFSDYSKDYWVSDEFGNTVEPAEYEVVNNFLFQKLDKKDSNTFYSAASSYDTYTHEHLGEYLRCYRDIYGVNLMPFYNCVSNRYVDDFYIDKTNEKYLIEKSNSSYRIMLVPIKYNTTYTLAIDCSVGCTICPVLYNELGLIKKKNTNSEYVSYDIDFTINSVSYRFDNPVTFSVHNEDYNLQQLEKYLFMAIQVPVINKSSVVVLEGNYTLNKGYVSATKRLSVQTHLNYSRSTQLDDETLNELLLSNLSLLSQNTQNNVPMSDGLMQYLLLNVITSREELSGNIEYIERLSAFTPKYKAVWDNILRVMFYQISFPQLNGNVSDFNGFVDRAVEVLLNNNKIKTKYNINYDAGLGAYAPASQYKYWNVPMKLTNEKPVYGNHTFLGWTLIKPELQKEVKIDYYPNVDNYITRNANATLYAVWGD